MAANVVSGSAAPPNIADAVAAVRRFNRFYTRQIGVLDEGHLDSPYSLAEVRVLYELAHRNAPSAAELARDLRLDAGYLSRLLRSFEERALIERDPSPTDGRRSHLRLTDAGREAFAPLNARASEEISALLAPLSDAERRRLLEALREVEVLLGGAADRVTGERAPWLLRAPRAGDLGWVVQRHGVLYAREYGWDERFEALVAGIVAHYVEHLDTARERCWIAERDGENVGSVFVVKHPEREGVAKLRLLLVEPSARGLGIGQRLVDECIRFARQAGYHTLMLWTNSVLVSARRIYEGAGFRLVHEETHRDFGPELVGQTWSLDLGGGR
ncbi:MAG TPA: bifunctional helix-turn-helix transcriptional regulator/GNAT family N-acetyltransferase [Gemmatimonadaceae bacterium]|nr:bifunctional helix-turn-helix transcriptional regulator/GNAT family N-acetyltransferase [Gemmatimonadaceae bacterium]